MSAGWSWYVIALVVLNIVGCVWLLWWTGKRRPGPGARQIPAMYGMAISPNTTSRCHAGGSTCSTSPSCSASATWSGSRASAHSPAPASGPRWASTTPTRPCRRRKLEATFSPYEGQAIDVLARDPKALQLGRSLFGNYCATCHGSSAQGAIGFPNLTDKIWHWGGTPDRVLHTVLDGRDGAMPPWGPVLTGMGGEHAVDDVVGLRRSLSSPDKSPAERLHGRAGQAALRGRLRRLPRPGRQGQSGSGRAGPDRRLLAVWRQQREPARRPAPRVAMA